MCRDNESICTQSRDSLLMHTTILVSVMWIYLAPIAEVFSQAPMNGSTQISSPNQTRLPPVLREAFLERERSKTGHIVYRKISESARDQRKQENIWDFRWSSKSFLTINSGDRDGFVAYDRNGQPLVAMHSCAPLIQFSKPDQSLYFEWWEGARRAVVYAASPSPEFDARTIGLVAAWLPNRSPSQLVEWLESSISDKARWSVTKTGELLQIRADIPPFDAQAKPTRREWVLDPGKDNQIISCRYDTIEPDGEPRYSNRCQTTYMRVDGRWWPNYSKTIQVDWTWEIEVMEATFDRPEHPKELTPAHMGIPVGQELLMRNLGLGSDDIYRWTGSEAVTEEEFKARGLDDSPFQQMRAMDDARGNREYPDWWSDSSGKFGIEALEQKPAEWETFVRRWCFVNNADDEQRKSAQGILKGCQDRAFGLFKKNRKELDEIEKTLASKSVDAKSIDVARTRQTALMRPVEEIFTELKGRLTPLLREGQGRDAPANTRK